MVVAYFLSHPVNTDGDIAELSVSLFSAQSNPPNNWPDPNHCKLNLWTWTQYPTQRMPNPTPVYRVAQRKVSHYHMIKKSYYIVWKPVNEIRFIRQLKVWIKHYNIIRWY